MAISIDPEVERYLRQQAREAGMEDVAAFIEMLVQEHRTRDPDAGERLTEEQLRQTPAWQAVQRMAGTASPELNADQIMNETRSER